MQAQYKSTADKAGGQKQDAAGPQKKGSGLKGLGFVAGQQALSTGGGGIPATWKVKKGDTLWEIAQNTLGDGSLWVQIWSANRSKTPNPHALSVGAVLQIPGGGPAAKKKKKTANTGGSYTVRSGDTLSK
ncbi:MAG: nucleoid-associated protein YgaU, partial [Myxococcota bacterium]